MFELFGHILALTYALHLLYCEVGDLALCALLSPLIDLRSDVFGSWVVVALKHLHGLVTSDA